MANTDKKQNPLNNDNANSNHHRFIKVIRQRRRQLQDEIERAANSDTYQKIMERADISYSRGLSFNIATDRTDTTNPDIDIYTSAEILMEQLNTGAIQLGALDLESKTKILYYLERYNKRVGRILDIQTRIPLSSMRLQKPKSKYRIVSDYIYKIFNEMFESVEFQAMLEQVVRSYWLFSYAAILIEDDYEFCKIELKDYETNIHKYRIVKLSDGEIKELEAIDTQYSKAPSSVTAKQRKYVIDTLFDRQQSNYRGALKYSFLPAMATLERFENNDINYYIYKIRISPEFKETINRVIEILPDEDKDNLNAISDQMLALGYTRAMTEAYFDLSVRPEESGYTGLSKNNKDEFLVDTNPFNNLGMYVVTLQRPGLTLKDNSLFNRVITDAIDLNLATQRLRDKINRGFKKDILVTVGENEDQAKIDELNQVLNEAASSTEGTITITNMEANVQDIDFNVNQNLDLSEIIDSSNQNIAEGVGVPESLITDSTDAYSNSFLKTVILESEMVNFRNQIKKFIEQKIFIPIAIKMGFVTEDEWGDKTVIIPEIRFNRMSLARGSDDLVFLQELASNGQMSLDVIFEALGLDYEDTMNKVIKEQTKIFNPSIRETIGSSIGEIYGPKIANSKRTKQEISENFEIPVDELNQDTSEEQDQIFNDRPRRR